ncbi:hypothetical protein C8F04DRAFT_882596, partial [Mycena alexandri]
KVTTTLPEFSPSNKIPVHVSDADLEPDPANHRGRASERELQRENLQMLLNVSSNKDFWVLVRGWLDSRCRPAQVDAEELRGVFETRLNPPEFLPDEFDVDERERHQSLMDILPSRTADTSPRRTFSRPFSIKDMEKVKVHIRKHNLKSA